MKRILSILSTIGIVVPSAALPVACGSSKSSEKPLAPLDLKDVKFTSAALNYNYMSNVNDGNDLKGRILTVYGEHLTKIQKWLNKDYHFQIRDQNGKNIVMTCEKFTWLDKDKIKNGESTDGVAYIFLFDPITAPGTYQFGYFDKDDSKKNISVDFVVPKENPTFIRIDPNDNDKELTIVGEKLDLVDPKDFKITALDPGDKSADDIVFTKNTSSSNPSSLVLDASKTLEKNTKYIMEWKPKGDEGLSLPEFETNVKMEKYDLKIVKNAMYPDGYDPDSVFPESNPDICDIDVSVEESAQIDGKDLWSQITVNGVGVLVAQVNGNLMHVRFLTKGISDGANVDLVFTGKDGSKQTITFEYDA